MSACCMYTLFLLCYLCLGPGMTVRFLALTVKQPDKTRRCVYVAFYSPVNIPMVPNLLASPRAATIEPSISTGSLRVSSRRNSTRRATTPVRSSTTSPHAASAVSILVTEASPDAAPQPTAPPTVVRVLVHRESDEQPS